MNRSQFLRALRAYSKENDLDYRFETGLGKGSHGRAYVGEAFTTVKDGEISNVLKQVMLKQLGLPKDAF